MNSDLDKIISVISYSDGVEIIGSYANEKEFIRKWSNDVDLNEKIYLSSKTKDEAYDEAAKIIQTILNKIEESNDVLLNELKMGYNNKYDKFMNLLEKEKDLTDEWDNLLKSKLITEFTYKKYYDIVQLSKINQISEGEYNQIHKRIHDLSVNRIYDTNIGFNDILKNLKTANTIKFDCVAKIGDYLTEVTNNIFFYYNNKPLNKADTSITSTEMRASLKNDASNYLNSDSNYNPYKALRRLYAYYNHFGDKYNRLSKIENILNSDIIKIKFYLTRLELYKLLNMDFEPFIDKIKELIEKNKYNDYILYDNAKHYIYSFINDVNDLVNTEIHIAMIKSKII